MSKLLDKESYALSLFFAINRSSKILYTMSTSSRNVDGSLQKRSIALGDSIAPPPSTAHLEVTEPDSTTFSSVRDEGQVIPISTQITSKVDVIPGTAKENSVLTCDLAKDVQGVGTIECDSITVGGVVKTSGAVSAPPLIDYVSDIVPGTASPTKLLVADASRDITISGNVSANKLKTQTWETRASPSGSSLKRMASLSNKTWLDVDCCKSNDVVVAVGNQALAVIGNTVTEINTNMDLRRVKWIEWEGSWLAIGSIGAYKTNTPTNDTWNDIPALSEAACLAIGTFNDIAFVVGSGFMAYSTDLISWDFVSIPGTNTDIAYGSGRYVITSTNSIHYSNEPQGPWTTVTLNGTWVGVEYGIGMFVAINNVSDSSLPRLAWSSDGINWSQHSQSPMHNVTQYIGISFSRIHYLWHIRSFAIVCGITTEVGIKWLLSKDGVNFTPQPVEGWSAISAITYRPRADTLVSVTRRKDPIGNDNNFFDFRPCSFEGVARLVNNVNRLHAVNTHIYTTTPGGFLVSTDGNKFTPCRLNGQSIEFTDGPVCAVAYSSASNKYIAVCSEPSLNTINRGNIMQSSDGINWQWVTTIGVPIRTSGFTNSNSSTGLTYSTLANKFVWIREGMEPLDSVDGVTWNIIGPVISLVGFTPIFWNHLNTIAITLSGSGIVVRITASTSGLTIENAATSISGVTGLCHHNGQFTYMDSSRIIRTSTDGFNWNANGMVPLSNAIRLYGGGPFIAITDTSNMVVTTRNRTTFTTSTPINMAVLAHTWSEHYQAWFGAIARLQHSIVRTTDNSCHIFVSPKSTQVTTIVSQPKTTADNMHDRLFCAFNTNQVTEGAINSQNTRLYFSKLNNAFYTYGAATATIQAVSFNSMMSLTNMNISSHTAIANSIVAEIGNALLVYASVSGSSRIYQVNAAMNSQLSISPIAFSTVTTSEFNQYMLAVVTTSTAALTSVSIFDNNNLISSFYTIPVARDITVKTIAPRENIEVLVLSTTGNLYLVNVDGSITTGSANSTFNHIIWCSDLKLWVAVGTTHNGYSSDGIVWTSVPTNSALQRAKFIVELGIIVSVGTNVFAYSFNGVHWFYQTITGNWTDIDYDTYLSVLVMIRPGARCLRSAPLMATDHNTSNLITSIVDDNGVYFPGPARLNIANRTHAFETGVIDFLTLMNGTNARRLFFSGAITDSNDVFHISEPAISLALPATNSTNGLQINGYNIDSVDDILFASSRTNTKSGARFVQLESNLGISVGNVNASSITVNPADDTSLLICDNSGKIDIDRLKTNSLKIGNLSIESNEESAVTGYNRLLFKHSGYSLTRASIPSGGAYSPYLNVVVIPWLANQSTTFATVAYSKDLGKTWEYSQIPSITALAARSRSPLKIVWSDQHKCFIWVVDSSLVISYDGENWTGISSAGSITASSHLVWSPVANNYFIIGSGGVQTISQTNPFTVTPGPAGTTTQVKVLYAPELSNFYAIASSSAVLTVSATINGTYTAHVTYPAIISDIIIGKQNRLYVLLSTGVIYYKNTATATVGTIVSTTGETNAISMQYLPYIDMYVVAGGDRYCVMDGNLSTPRRIPYPRDAFTTQTPNGGAIFIDTPASTIMVQVNNGVICTSNSEVQSSTTIQNLAYMCETRVSDISTTLIENAGTNVYIDNALSDIPQRGTHSIAYNGSLYCMCGVNFIAYTSDIKDLATFVTLSGTWIDICWDGSRFVAISSNGMVAYNTTDMNTWVTYSITPTYVLTSIQSNLTSTLISTTSCILETSNITANNWTASNVGTKWSSVRWLNNRWVATGLNVIAHRSESSNTWSYMYILGDWLDIAYGNTFWVFVGPGYIGRSKYLTKGITVGIHGVYRSIAYSSHAGTFMALRDCDMIPSQGKIIIVYSKNGINWQPSGDIRDGLINANKTFRLNRVFWFQEVSRWVFPVVESSSTTSRTNILMTQPVAALDRTIVKALPTTIKQSTLGGGLDIAYLNYVDSANRSIAVRIDSAAKPATSTWTTTSDARVKEDIEPANIDMCYNFVKNLPLRRYKWKQQYIDECSEEDHHKLGWIAQEVEQFDPKSVDTLDSFAGVENCKTLNTDQIIANMWGALQKLMQKIEEKEQALAST